MIRTTGFLPSDRHVAASFVDVSPRNVRVIDFPRPSFVVSAVGS